MNAMGDYFELELPIGEKCPKKLIHLNIWQPEIAPLFVDSERLS